MLDEVLQQTICEASTSDSHMGGTDLELHKETYIRDLEKKKVGRQSAISIIHSTNVVPFRFNGNFMCLYCPSRYTAMPDLEQHVQIKHGNISEEDIRKAIVNIRKYLPIKVHVPNFTCKICSVEMCSFDDLKHHLIDKHEKPIDPNNYGVWPHYITTAEFNCVLCGQQLEEYRLLNKHIIEHYSNDSEGEATSKVVKVNTTKTSTVVNTIKETENVNNLTVLELNKIGRTSAIAIIHSTNVCPFKFNGKFMCLFCPSQYVSMPELAQHVELKHKLASAGEIMKAVRSSRKYNPIKINFLDFSCKLCNDEISNFEELTHHLVVKHKKPIDPANIGVWPFRVTNDEFSCVMCGKNYEDYRQLHKHVIFEHDTRTKITTGETKSKFVPVRVRMNNSVLKFHNEAFLHDLKQKQISRQSAIAIIHNTNVCPFKFARFYMCLYCPSRYATMTELTEHVELQHKLVTAEDIKKGILKIHCYKPLKVNVLDFGCKLCDDVLLSFDELKKHLIGEHKQPIDPNNDGVWPYKITENEFNCVLCDKEFDHFWLLNRHINEHYKKYICDQCGSGFASDIRLKTHMASHVVGNYPCDDCGKVFNSNMLMQQHMDRVHRKVKKHKCLYCMETFREYHQKRRHIRTVHGMDQKNYKCGFCPKVFDSAEKVRNHERYIHIKAQKFRCDICNYVCSMKNMLMDHMMCHSDKKNFVCQFCKKAYARRKTLVEHLRIHYDDRRFVCQYCEKAFVQKCSLKGHMKTHHKEYMM